jgi:electron transfer flavoprotein alpha subunit
VIPYTQPDAEKLILVLLQARAGGVHSLSLELAGAARRLAVEGGFRTAGAFFTGNLSAAAETALETCGLEDVWVYQDERFSPFVPELHASALVHCAGTLRPSILLAGATPEGRSVAPLAAVPLETGVTADCTDLAIGAGGLLVQTRPAFGGGLMARIITPLARPQIATVRYGVLRGAEAPGKTRLRSASVGPLPPARTRIEALAPSGVSGDDDDDTEYALVLGGGIRGREDIGLFKRMGESLKADVFCSRILVERGWFPQSRQVGLSGRCIAPRLLITLGVSGSVQFMAGIQGAKKICAVTTDPLAPILRIADLPLICDLYQVAALFQA